MSYYTIPIVVTKGEWKRLDMKLVLMYPAIFAATIWIIYNVYMVNEQSQNLKQHFPSCTTTNPNRVFIFVATMVVLVLT